MFAYISIVLFSSDLGPHEFQDRIFLFTDMTMATIRVNISKEEEPETEKKFEDMTLMEKWKNRHKHMADTPTRFKQHTRILYAFQSTTQLYMFMVYIIPRLFEDEWSQYWLKVLTVFLCIQWLMNFFCTILYSTDIKKTRDNPSVQVKDRWENPPEYFESLISDTPNSNSNGHASQVIQMQMVDSGMQWSYCEKCEMNIPPRARHCSVCKTCILKRDHHCYFAGTCIGFRNQRFFFVWAFYSIWVGALGFYFTYLYLREFYWPQAYSWTDFIPMVSFYRWYYQQTEISPHIILLITHLYLELVCAFMGMVYFTVQTVLVTKGVTMFEFTKVISVKNTNSINANFRSVFGDFWALNFLFPMIILFKQRDDGMQWHGVKIDYNGNVNNNGMKVHNK